jgi:hypothetical protein
MQKGEIFVKNSSHEEHYFGNEQMYESIFSKF